MKSVIVYKHDGSEAGTLDLPKEIFGIEPSMTVLYQVIKAHLANKRQGNVCTKSRSEVNVSKSKPYRQKGTGRARAGSANSPIWVGGGVAFGPKTRSYRQKVNKKVRMAGLKSAYSIKASEGGIMVVEDFSLNEPKTSTVANVLKVLGIADKKIMFIAPEKDENLYKSTRNIPKLNMEMTENANAYDVTNSEVLLFTRTSVDRVKEFFKR